MIPMPRILTPYIRAPLSLLELFSFGTPLVFSLGLADCIDDELLRKARRSHIDDVFIRYRLRR